MAKKNGSIWFVLILLALGGAGYYFYPQIQERFGTKQAEQKNKAAPTGKPAQKDTSAAPPPAAENTEWSRAFAEGDYSKAEKLVETGLEKNTIENIPEALLISGKAALKNNREKEGVNDLEQVVKKYPQSTQAPAALAELLNRSLRTQDYASLIPLVDTAAAKYPDNPKVGNACKAAAPKLYEKYSADKNQWHTLWKVFSMAFNAADSKSSRKQYADRLQKINDYVIFSPAHIQGDSHFKIHTVSPGENLKKIGKKYNCTSSLIQQINNIENPRTLQVGDRLKIVVGEASAVVDKSEFTLTLYLDSLFIKQYAVGLGKLNKTPVGEFKVESKDINPNWFYKGEKIPYTGDPEGRNLLGTRWIGLSIRGYGIHGTWKPETIGKNLSNGCVRMHNKNVEELYKFLQPGDKVVIK